MTMMGQEIPILISYTGQLGRVLNKQNGTIPCQYQLPTAPISNCLPCCKCNIHLSYFPCRNMTYTVVTSPVFTFYFVSKKCGKSRCFFISHKMFLLSFNHRKSGIKWQKMLNKKLRSSFVNSLDFTPDSITT